MTSIHAGIPIDINTAKKIDTSNMKPVKLSGEAFTNFIEQEEQFLKGLHGTLPDTSNNPTYQPYATVKVNGRVVAEIDNHGWVTTSKAFGGKLHDELPSEANGRIAGPILAQARADFLAQQLGGRVEMAQSALTQDVFDTIPQPHPSVDYAALAADPRYQNLQGTKTAHIAFLVQEIDQSEETTEAKRTGDAEPAAAVGGDTTEPAIDPVAAFLEEAQKTPEQRLYEAILKEKGLTPEELAALPPEERAVIQEEIKEEIERRIKRQVGAPSDGSSEVVQSGTDTSLAAVKA